MLAKKRISWRLPANSGNTPPRSTQKRRKSLTMGVRATYDRGEGIPPRTRRRPYNTARSFRSKLTDRKMWKDIRARRACAFPESHVKDDTPIEAAPTKTVAKKNPGRAISDCRRIIADVRRENIGLNPAQYFPARSPSIEDICRTLISLALLFHGMAVQMAKRDIASSCRLLRLRQSLSLLVYTELPGRHFNLRADIVLV